MTCSAASRNYDLNGNFLGSFDLALGFLVGLAYEQATDTLWGFNTETDNLVQFTKTGQILQDIDIPNFDPYNPYGGEIMVRINTTQPVPEAASVVALLGFGALGAGSVLKRK